MVKTEKENQETEKAIASKWRGGGIADAKKGELWEMAASTDSSIAENLTEERILRDSSGAWGIVVSSGRSRRAISEDELG